jgi:hypothetical protein
MDTETSAQSPDFKQRVRRLAVHRPFGAGKVTVEFVRRQLVLAAAQESGENGFGSLAECADSCQSLWGLALDIDELRDDVKALVDAGRLRKEDGRYSLTAAARSELTAVVEQSTEIESMALVEWEGTVRTLAPALGSSEIATLREDLQAWLQRIIIHYGAEAALILYPEEERAARFFLDVEQLGFDFLPPRDPAVLEARAQALYKFIREPTRAQRAHIANLMTTAYLVAVLTLDPAAERLVRAITRGQRVYLDTNVLWTALNLNGPRAYLSTKRVLDMTRDLGFELAVTPWTIAEMKRSVRHGREQLARTALPPRALAEIAADAGSDTSFITAYWRRYKETGVTPKDFCDLHDQVEGLVEKLGIAIMDEGCTSVEQIPEVIGDRVSLLEHIRGAESKAEPVKEHDAKHRILIEKLRGTHERKFSNAGYWFLTRDGLLIPYGLLDRAPGALPFAVSLTSWAQIVRGFTARTEDYERTLVDLLDTPSLRPRGGIINPQVIAETLGRIDLLVEDSTEEVAARVMLDSAALVEIEARDGEARTAQIDAVVAEKSREMERQLAEAQRELGEERVARAEVERQARAAEATTARAELERAGAQEDFERELAVAGQRITNAEQRITQAEERAEAAESRAKATQDDFVQAARDRTDRRARLTRRSAGAAVAMFGLAVGLVPAVTGWLSGWPLVGVIVAGGLLCTLGAYVGIHLRAARFLLLTAVTTIGAVTGIHEMVAPSSSSPPSKTTVKR